MESLELGYLIELIIKNNVLLIRILYEFQMTCFLFFKLLFIFKRKNERACAQAREGQKRMERGNPK